MRKLRSFALNKIAITIASFIPALALAEARPGTCDIFAHASSYGPRLNAAIVHAAEFAGVGRDKSSALWNVTEKDVDDLMSHVSQAYVLNSLGMLNIENAAWEIKTSSLGADFFTVSVDLRNSTPSTISSVSRLEFGLVSPGRSVPWVSSADYLIDVPGGIEPGETVTVGPQFDVIGHELPNVDIPESAEVVVTHITACGPQDSFVWSGRPSS